MERGESSNQQHKKFIPSSNSGLAIPNHENNTSRSTNKRRSQRKSRDEYMPIANVTRIMRRILPPHAKISDEAKFTVQDCLSKYISQVTIAANARCHNEVRKTIISEDIIWAIDNMGLDDYIDPLTAYLNRFREHASARDSAYAQLPPPPMVEYEKTPPSVVDYLQTPMVPAFYENPFLMGYPQAQMGQEVFDDPTAVFNGFYSNPLGGDSSGSSHDAQADGALASFDPYAQFK